MMENSENLQTFVKLFRHHPVKCDKKLTLRKQRREMAINRKRGHGKHSWFSYAFALGIVFLIGIVFLSYLARETYWKTSYLQNFSMDISRYATDWKALDANQSSTKDAVRACNEAGVPAPAECLNYFEQCNRLISSYFQEVHSVDVSDKLNALHVMKATYPEEIANTVGGSFSANLGGLFINAALLDDFMEAVSEGLHPSVQEEKILSCKMLRHVYIHETIHALGFTNQQLDCLNEAITEALTEDVITYSGLKYENLTGYGEIKDLAAQIIDANPEIIRLALQEKSFKIGNHIGQILGSNHAETLDHLLFIMQSGGSKQYPEIPYLSQYLVYEYIKAVDSSATRQSEYAKNGIIPAFEWKWLLKNMDILIGKAA